MSPQKSASSDIVVTANIGSPNTYYVDLGINSSQYTGEYVGNSGDGYLYSQANDFYIGNTNTGRSINFFVGAPVNDPNNALISISTGGIIFGTPNLNMIKTTTPALGADSNHSNLYMENLAQRSILSYANNRGIGKMIQNTMAIENIHNFSPNTTTTMNPFGTTATSAGTLSHPTAYVNITGYGFCTHFACALGVAGGIESATAPFFLTSGTTGLGAGFFFASQFAITGVSGNYTTVTGFNSGSRFFVGMTDAATNVASVQAPYPAAALFGFQMIRSSGASGRVDSSFKFVTKNNGATAPFYVQEFFPNNNYAAFLYGRNDFRNGTHWMIKNLNAGTLFSGDFTGAFNMLPLVTPAVQIFLRPSIALQVLSGNTPVGGVTQGGQFLLKGLYCETV